MCKGIPDGFSLFNELKISLPKLILLDIMLPQWSGDGILKQLKSDERYNKIPVYFITAIPERTVKEMAENLGATGYILKPFNLSDLDEITKHLKNGK
jgi:CheY-like chemotaxis protein